MANHGVVPASLASRTRGVIEPVAKALVRMGVGANAVTVVGFLITVAGAAVLALGSPLPALGLLIVGTLSDALDGQVARASGGGTRAGAFLDSTLDRLADAALAVSAVVLGIRESNPILIGAGLAALIASFLVSYVRARAEALGLRGNTGAAPREARIVLFLVGVAVWGLTGNGRFFELAVIAIAVLATLTFADRVTSVLAALRKEGN